MDYYGNYYDEYYAMLNQFDWQRIAALEEQVRRQNQRIRNLERRVGVLERTVFRTREGEEQSG
jgi:hypothetical protein